MAELFVLAFLGHLVGDYLLQSTWMAVTKSERNALGWFACTVHVLLYTIAVCGMMGVSDPVVWVVVFIPHWVIDHWSLGELWSSLIGGRTKKKTMSLPQGSITREFGFAFYAPVYIAVDNTWHLICLWATIKLLII